MIPNANDNNTAAALAFAANVTEPRVVAVNFEGREEQILITRDGSGNTATDLVRDLCAAHATAPEQRKGTIDVHSVDTFIAFVNRDKRPDSVIFADVGARKLTAILDFHGRADTAPRFGHDRIVYGFKLSRQLETWLNASRSPMSQRQFAKLIDDHLGDVCEERPVPGSVAAEFARRRNVSLAGPADLVAFTRTIATKSATDSEEIYDENTGAVSIQYKKRNDVKTPDGQPITVPQAFALKVPVLNGPGATEFTIAARLRFDIGPGGILWTIDINAIDVYIAAAIEECLVTVRRPADTSALAAEVVAERDACAGIAASNDALDTRAAIRARTVPHLPGGCGLPVYLATAPA